MTPEEIKAECPEFDYLVDRLSNKTLTTSENKLLQALALSRKRLRIAMTQLETQLALEAENIKLRRALTKISRLNGDQRYTDEETNENQLPVTKENEEWI